MNVWIIFANCLIIQISTCVSFSIECKGMCHSKNHKSDVKKPFICSAKAIDHMIWGNGQTIPAELPKSIRATWSTASKNSASIHLFVKWKMTGAQFQDEQTSFLLLLIRARAYERKFRVDIRKNHNYLGKSVNTKNIQFSFEFCERDYASYIQPAMTYYWNFMSIPVYEQSDKNQLRTSVAVPGLVDDDYEYDDIPDKPRKALPDQAKKSNKKTVTVVKTDDEDYNEEVGSGNKRPSLYKTISTSFGSKIILKGHERRKKKAFDHGLICAVAHWLIVFGIFLQVAIALVGRLGWTKQVKVYKENSIGSEDTWLP